MPQQNSNQSLKVENVADLLIILLYAPEKPGRYNHPIDGITRLQKLVYLLREGRGPGELVEMAKELEYRPYKMGPYAEGLQDTISQLVSADIIKTERLRYFLNDDDDPRQEDPDNEANVPKKCVESSRYCLTEFGEKIGAELWSSLGKRNQRELSKFKIFFAELSLRQLLIFVYENYPGMTSESEIKAQLGLH